MQDGASTLMSIRDAAEATGLSPKALRRRIERGTLASVMIGGRRRIPMEALARRGLIVAGHDPISAHRLPGAGSPAEAIEERLRRLESRVSALEAGARAAVAGAAVRSDGSNGRDTDSKDGADARPDSGSPDGSSHQAAAAAAAGDGA